MSISKPKRGVPNLPATKFILYDLVWALNIRGIFSSQIKKPNLLMLLWTQKLVDFSLCFLEDNLPRLRIMTYDILVTPTYHTFRNLSENQRQILCFKLVVLYSKCWIVPSGAPAHPLYLAWGEYVMSDMSYGKGNSKPANICKYFKKILSKARKFFSTKEKWTGCF